MNKMDIRTQASILTLVSIMLLLIAGAVLIADLSTNINAVLSAFLSFSVFALNLYWFRKNIKYLPIRTVILLLSLLIFVLSMWCFF